MGGENKTLSFAKKVEAIVSWWRSIIASLIFIGGTLIGGASFASQQFHQAVETKVEAIIKEMKLAEVVKKNDFEALERRFNGVQEQVNTGINQNAELKRQWEAFGKSLQDRAEDRDKAHGEKLDLIIKMFNKE